MRISDWSSDVCSSDLDLLAASGHGLGGVENEVQQNLLNEARPGDHFGQIGCRLETDLHLAQKTVSQQLQRLARDGHDIDRKSAGQGKSLSIRVDLGGPPHLKKKNPTTTHPTNN